MNEVPLANISEEWNEFNEINSKTSQNESNGANVFYNNFTIKDEILNLINTKFSNENNLDLNKNFLETKLNEDEDDEFEQINKVESLEDLVNTFDEKIVKCFVNYEEPVEHLTPVKVLNHEELINECQMWWTLTGNFGQILPIDWKSTYAIKLLLPYLTGNQQSAAKADESLELNKRASSVARTKCENQNAKDNLIVNNLNSSCKLNAKRKDYLNIDLNEDAYLGDHLSNYKDFSTNYEFDFDSSEDDDEFILSTLSYDYSSHNLTRLNNSDETLSINNQSFYYKTHFQDEDEEQLAKDLDFHCLILCSNNELHNTNVNETNGIKQDHEDSNLLFTAEQVLKEIDIFLQENDEDFDNKQNSTFNDSCATLDYQPNATDLMYNNVKTLSLANLTYKQHDESNSITASYSSNSLDDIISNNHTLNLSQTINPIKEINLKKDNQSLKDTFIESNNRELYKQHLNNLNITQLNEVYLELERLIQHYSEILIQELALRDELEFEKELKNTFISLLLSIQNKKRKQILHKRHNPKSVEVGNKYLTTIIPYNPEDDLLDVRTLQILIKILKAINEDSPTVPNLLTDFILKVLCPTK